VGGLGRKACFAALCGGKAEDGVGRIFELQFDEFGSQEAPMCLIAFDILASFSQLLQSRCIGMREILFSKIFRRMRCSIPVYFCSIASKKTNSDIFFK
jgi:hypothetical protein